MLSKLIDAQGKVYEIELMEDFLKDHEKLAQANRMLLDEHRVYMIDVMGSVGAGKTALIEQMVRHLKQTHRIVILNGDLATTIDQDRILQHGVEAIQVNTGKECHLDAVLVRTVLDRLDLENIDLVIVENVGNLICPVDFPLGSDMRVLVTGVTEGPYAAVKHPHVFAGMDVVVVNKIDLAQIMEIDVSKMVQDIKSVNPHAAVYEISSKDGQGIPELIKGLMGEFEHCTNSALLRGL